MSPRFTPCPSCARHVKLGDSTCPFCGEHVPHVTAQARMAVGRLSRSALFAASAAGLAITTLDCGSMGTDYGNPCTTANGSDTCTLTVEDAAPEDASTDAADSGSSTADASAEAGPTEGGSDGAAVPPTDGGEAGH
jgi:hypothetical protein